MSDNAQADLQSIRELDMLVRHLVDDLAAFRRRALVAEARLKEVESQDGGSANLELAARVNQLEQDNERLQTKLQQATNRVKQMLDRVRFLRQQAQGGER
jgi:seryl-tRNA synthetase